jgi:hypothetical protein
VTIVVGYVPTPVGRAALMAAADVAGERDQPLIVVNSSRGDGLVDPGYAQQADLDWPAPRWKKPASSSASASTCVGAKPSKRCWTW